MSYQNLLQPLRQIAFQYGQIQPLGWLKQQLEKQYNGLSGNLDEFWPDIKDSAWFGGKAEGWERVPYWLDGVIPLAKILNNQQLTNKINKYMDHILKNQDDDGWLGSKQSNIQNQNQNYDLWGQFLILKVLIFYCQAEPQKTEKILIAVEKGLKSIESTINYQPLFNWGQARWFEAFIAIYWLYEKKIMQGYNNEQLKWLLDLINKLEAQGFGWKSFYKNWPMKQEERKWNYMSHIVNNAMAIKAYALCYRLTKDKSEQIICDSIIQQLDQYHGTVVGTFTGDECLAGKDPIRGTELCAVVELMFSLENLIQIFGDAKYCNQLEKIAYNALPGYFKEDMWAHQYDSQVNQIECSITEEKPWNTNSTDANIYGLEPHYGCCLANYHQGWPKFVSNLWMYDQQENSIVQICYAPCKLECSIQNSKIIIIEETNYPFSDYVMFTIQVEKPQQFSIKLRLPEWIEQQSFILKGIEQYVIKEQYICINQLWNEKTQFSIQFPTKIGCITRFNNSLTIFRGPLIFSLKIDENWKRINEDMPLRELPHGDFEVLAGSKWNYAIAVNKNNIELCFQIQQQQLTPDWVFNNKYPPIILICKGIELENWKSNNGSHCPIPQSPIIISKEQKIKEQSLQLIPYGCTHLRLTEIPYYEPQIIQQINSKF